MNIFYDGDRDYAEVFFKKTQNYGEELSERVTVFKSEKSDKTVGYGFEDASRTLFDQDLLSPAVKLAALLADVGQCEEDGAEELLSLLRGKPEREQEENGARELDPDAYEFAHRCPKCHFEFNE
jgi:hypothetical protein